MIFAIKEVRRTQIRKTIINATTLMRVGFNEKKLLIISLANFENLTPPRIPKKIDKKDAASMTRPFSKTPDRS